MPDRLTGLLALDTEDQKKRSVFEKGTPIAGQDPFFWRADSFGNPLYFPHHGDQCSPFGWQMDHYPVARMLGGSDDISNLRPLHCSLNALQGGIMSLLANQVGGMGGLGGMPR